jgi:hypothetical protein
MDNLLKYGFLFEAAPPATDENPRPRPKIVPGTFQVLEVGK